MFSNVPWLVALVYAIVSAAWISYSDELLVSLVSRIDEYQGLQTYKGWGFVAVSSLLIFFALRFAWQRLTTAYESSVQSERRLNLAMSSASGGTWELDLLDEGRSIVHLSEDLVSRLGLPPGQSQITMEELVKRRHPEDNEHARQMLNQAIASKGAKPYSARYRLQTTAGTYRWVQASGNVILSSDGRPSKVLGVALDITAQVEAEQALEKALRFDSATGLSKQANFVADVDTRVASLSHDEHVAVVQFRLLDIDDLAEPGECLHESRAIRHVGDRLRGLSGVVGARLASDVFAFAFVAPKGMESAELKAQNVLREILRPIYSGDQCARLRAQAGGVLGQQKGMSATALVRDSGRAMESAERTATADLLWFNEELRGEANKRRALVHGLENALGNNEIACHFQPIVDTKRGKTWGFEALARWRLSGELVPPDVFIPLAEKNGLIGDIGEAILMKACTAACSWPEPHPIVAVNVSPFQLDDAAFPAKVARILAKTGLSPSRLELEITESALAKNFETASQRLQALREMGVQIAIDDFGTGYSSLSLLSAIPFSRLKIDRSFISGEESSRRNSAICNMIISLARSLDLAVTAEGVETFAQASMLIEKGVDCLQGYYFARAVEESEAVELAQQDWEFETARALETRNRALPN